MSRVAVSSPVAGTGVFTLSPPATNTDHTLTLPDAGGTLHTSESTNDNASMPTVNGDPIVESGSNSDGEWTRWAEGTQQCTSPTPFNNDGASGTASSTLVTMPIAFIGDYYVNWSANNATAGNGFVNANSHSDTVVRALGYSISSGFNAAGSRATFQGFFFCSGRWK